MRTVSIALTIGLLASFSGSGVAQFTGPAVGISSEHLVSSPAPLTCFQLIDQDDGCLVVGRQIANHTLPFNVIDLNGAWSYNGQPGPYIYVYGQGNSLFIDMSLYNRPDGFGNIIDATTFSVVFPDDTDYTATLESPTRIRWSNGTVWTKL
jgi:hypothetical protein